jgi:hypothetical protein
VKEQACDLMATEFSPIKCDPHTYSDSLILILISFLSPSCNDVLKA